MSVSGAGSNEKQNNDDQFDIDGKFNMVSELFLIEKKNSFSIEKNRNKSN